MDGKLFYAFLDAADSIKKATNVGRSDMFAVKKREASKQTTDGSCGCAICVRHRPKDTMASNSLKSVNPNAEIMSKAAALFMNINAAKGLQDVMKSNLGPKGTIKMLVGGAGGTCG